MGNSIAVLAFAAHDLLHGSIYRHWRMQHLLGCLLFALHGMPPTLWEVLHNRTHHTQTNGMKDPLIVSTNTSNLVPGVNG